MEMNRESFFESNSFEFLHFGEKTTQPVKKSMFLGQMMIPKQSFGVTLAGVAIICHKCLKSIFSRREPTWSLTSKVMWLSSPGPGVFVSLDAEAEENQNM